MRFLGFEKLYKIIIMTNIDKKAEQRSVRLNKIRNGAVSMTTSCHAVFAKLEKLFLNFFNKYQIDTKFALYLSFLVIIVFMPWISESSANQQIYADLKKFSEPLDPVKAGEMTESISKFTPGLIESPEDVIIARMIENGSYTLSQQLAINEDKTFEVPERADATYTVGAGESIAQIAAKFDLHVASILDANQIKPEDSKKIRSGAILKIPSSDTSTSSDWIVAINAADEAERQAQAKKLADAQKAKQLALAKTLSKTSKQASSAYSGADSGGLSFPLGSSKGVSQSFGRGHTGVDFMCNVGAPIYAAAAGKVVITSTGWSGGYGNQIVVDHGGSRATRYAHLSSIAASSGTVVGRGSLIGYCGNTGRSTGPHLHFELIISGRPVAPKL